MIALRSPGTYKISTCYIPEVLIKMKVGEASNRSISNILRKASEDLRAMKMHNIGGLPTLRKNLSKLPQFFKKPDPSPKTSTPEVQGSASNSRSYVRPSVLTFLQCYAYWS